MGGYVVTRPYEDSGVGSNLASLAGALWLAQRLGRTLLVDWREHTELTDKRLNYFEEFLSLPSTVAGVEVVPVPSGDSSFAPDEASVRWLQPGDGRALGTGASTAAEGYLALKTYHGLDRVHPGPESERHRILREVYRALEPGPDVAAAVERYVESRFADFRCVIGLNVRTGNGSRSFSSSGAYAKRIDSSLFDDQGRFLRLLERACDRIVRRLPRPLRTSCGIFCVTDSSEMSALLARLPNAITRRAVFPPPGVDHRYAFSGSDYTDRDSVVDTLADMFLLARCDGLVYNGSLFNQYARVVTDGFGGSCVHVESLLVRKRVRDAARSLRRRLA